MTHPTFSHIPLPTTVQQEMMDTGVWAPHCPVSLNRLSLVQFSYHDFTGRIHYDGSVVVLDAVASHVENIFRHLFLQRFPIHTAKRMEHFEGSDDASMEANNSSAFNYRPIGGSNIISLHSYGVAIDINPVQNPCLCHPKIVPNEGYSLMEVWPAEGTEFLNRANQRPGMVEPIVDLFAENGFREWGGTWNDMVDYHHFQLSRSLAELLVAMKREHAEAFFRAYVLDEHILEIQPKLDQKYTKDPEGFMRKLGL